jgi:hypothetical protein
MTPQTTSTAPERKAFDCQLDSGLLVAEAEVGGYEPVALVSTINEALELADTNFRRRLKEFEQGRETMCPARYAVWARGFDGAFERVHEIE